MRDNLYKIIWIVGMFLTLILILAMMMTYKIKYQDSIYYKYLYFYNCNDDICATTKEKQIEDKSIIYSVYKYRKKMPTFNKINNEYVKIYDNNDVVLYNIHNKVLTKNYVDYSIINTNNTIFKAVTKDKLCGLINSNGKKITGLIYDDFKTYNNEVIAAIYKGKYGSITLDGKKTYIEFEYDYIEIFDDIIITVKDNLLDIINTDKESLLSDKIEVADVNNLSLNKDDNVINIKITNKDGFDEYKFDVVEKKLNN